jgi:hypothetical protein
MLDLRIYNSLIRAIRTHLWQFLCYGPTPYRGFSSYLAIDPVATKAECYSTVSLLKVCVRKLRP